jgi:hypothetical protein
LPILVLHRALSALKVAEASETHLSAARWELLLSTIELDK